jgi:hypothetical protein
MMIVDDEWNEWVLLNEGGKMELLIMTSSNHD